MSGVTGGRIVGGLMALTVICLLYFCLAFMQQDWRHFSLEKQVATWQLNARPSLDEVGDVAAQIRANLGSNPNSFRLYALALEWQAVLDQANYRFYLAGAEAALLHSLHLRPTDSRAWAHLAFVKSKLRRDVNDIHASYSKAKQFGAGDRETQKILKQLISG